MRAFSPAKVNLSLRVLGRRNNGFHEIRGLFQAIDLIDTITLLPAVRDRLTCTDAMIPTDGSNLAIKALRLFRAVLPTPPFHIHIDKQIPVGAGLGGGSSNAATVLWLLNRWHHTPFTTAQLQTLARAIGSDVPFFFSHGSALIHGIGDTIEETAPLPPHPLCIVKPPFALSTAAVYAITIPRSGSDTPLFHNDLEHAAFRLAPQLKDWKNALIHLGHSPVWMTGSGSALIHFGTHSVPGAIKTRFVNRPKSSWYTTLS